MKNLLFILTVLLCTVSCTKDDVQPANFNWNTQLKQHIKYSNWNNDTYLFNTNTIQITTKNEKYNGNYTIVSNNEIRINIYYNNNWLSNTYSNCTKSNDSIYCNNNFLFKELK